MVEWFYSNDCEALKLDTETTKFNFSVDKSANARELMTYVLYALKEKGYNPINQLVGYFISGDPTYITSYKGARGVIKRIDRDEQIGKELEVLIEVDHDDMYVGYTREYVKALVSHDKKLEIGGITKVEATGSMYSSLICKVF